MYNFVMQKLLGGILLEKGYIGSRDLNRALVYQMRKVVGADSLASANAAESFILDIARTKYNNRDEFYLGRILTELKLLPEVTVREALEIQRAGDVDKPRGKLDALRSISVRMNSSYNLIDLLRQLLIYAAQLVEAESASLIVHEHASNSLVILMPTGPGADRVREQTVPRGRGIVGWVYENSCSQISNDVAHDPRFYPGIDEASGYTTRQVLCVPLCVKNRRLGAIEAINKTSGPLAVFSTADLFLLEMLSAQAAVAIENTRLTLALARAEEEVGVRASLAVDAERTRVAAQLCDSFLHQMEKSFVPLKGYAEKMNDALRDPRAEKYSAFIDAEMTRLTREAESTLHFFRNEYPLKLRNVDLAELMRELESRTWVECRLSGVAFRSTCPQQMRVNVDRDLFLYALEKLFHNSRQAMREGGTFSLEASRPESGGVALSVLDTGLGFPPAVLDRLFEPFSPSTTPHAAGLGLAVVKGIIGAHGGRITAGNRDDTRGARVRITLPV
jgi:signal transduction histidine kinase